MITTTSLLAVGSMAELGCVIAVGAIPDADMVLFGAVLEPAGITDGDLSAGIDFYLRDTNLRDTKKSYWPGTLGRMVSDPVRANYLSTIQGQLGRWGFYPPPRPDLPEDFFVPVLPTSQSVSAQIYAHGGGILPTRVGRSILKMAGPSGRTTRPTPPPPAKGPSEETRIFGPREDLDKQALGFLKRSCVIIFNNLRLTKEGENWRPFLPEAQLSQKRLVGANFEEADLRGADLTGADLKSATLVRALLAGARLGGADLRLANLSEANLKRADLTGANLAGARLSGADLDGTRLSGAILSGAILSRAINFTPEQLSTAASLGGVHVSHDQREIVARALRMTPHTSEATLIGVGFHVDDEGDDEGDEGGD